MFDVLLWTTRIELPSLNYRQDHDYVACVSLELALQRIAVGSKMGGRRLLVCRTHVDVRSLPYGGSRRLHVC